MKILQRIVICILVCGTAFLFSPAPTSSQAAAGAGAPVPVALVPNPCTPRFAAGSVVHQPPELYSENGVLNVRFSYQETTDSVGRLLHCFMTPDGMQEPTLHVNPGDTLNITVTNNTLASPLGEVYTAPNCGDTTVEFTPPASGTTSIGSSVNIHYHGTNVTPQCGGDNVTRTSDQFRQHLPVPLLISKGRTSRPLLVSPARSRTRRAGSSGRRNGGAGIGRNSESAARGPRIARAHPGDARSASDSRSGRRPGQLRRRSSFPGPERQLCAHRFQAASERQRNVHSCRPAHGARRNPILARQQQHRRHHPRPAGAL